MKSGLIRPFPKSEHGRDALRVAALIAACVVLGIACNAVGIIRLMSAASDLSGN